MKNSIILLILCFAFSIDQMNRDNIIIQMDEDNIAIEEFCWGLSNIVISEIDFLVTVSDVNNVYAEVIYDSGICADLLIIPIENYNGFVTIDVDIMVVASYCSNPLYDNQSDCQGNFGMWFENISSNYEQVFEVTINPVNDLPFFSGDIPDTFTLPMGNVWNFDMTPYVFDVEGDSVIYDWEIFFSDNVGLEDLNVEGNLFSFNPGSDFIGSADLDVWVSDESFESIRTEMDLTHFYIEWINENTNDCDGDVTGDGVVNVNDLVQMVHCILNNTNDCVCGDLDNSNTIDVNDIVLMVEMILA